MSNIFIKKNEYPKEKFIGFLKDITIINNNQYLFDLNLFKKYMFNNKIQSFIDSLKPHYLSKKRSYLEREITYKNFVTILRQLCKKFDITYTTKIKYFHNMYNIQYYFNII